MTNPGHVDLALPVVEVYSINLEKSPSSGEWEAYLTLPSFLSRHLNTAI